MTILAILLLLVGKNNTLLFSCQKPRLKPCVQFNFLIIITLFIAASNSALTSTTNKKCQRINIIPCQDFYNSTYYPNPLVDVDTQEEAARTVHEFHTLFTLNCAPLLRFFVCSMYVPMCYERNGVAETVHSCRPICEQARKGCEPLMVRFGFLWPEKLDCRKLPYSSSSTSLCMSAPTGMGEKNDTNSKGTKTTPILPSFTGSSLVTRSPIVTENVLDILPRTREDLLELLRQKGIAERKDFNWDLFKGKAVYNISLDTQFLCDLLSPKFIYVENEKDGGKCLQSCNSTIAFNSSDKNFSFFWISVWAIICLISTTVTVLTFCIDTKRFRYPERPIVFLSMCYLMCSVGFIVRMIAGRDVISCRKLKDESHLMIAGGTAPPGCVFVFVMLYYFTMASSIWWVILSLTWFLTSALKWGHEAVQKYTALFHTIAWTLPALLTIIALVTRKVDADELSGICFIGNTDSKNLLWFIILPLSIFLFIGSIFVITGFTALFKIRKILRRKTNTFKLERLMFRIGMFTVLYIVPASFVIGCFVRDYIRLIGMEKAEGNVVNCLVRPLCVKKYPAEIEIIYLKYFMLLVVGITSGLWIWTSKTLSSWRTCYHKCGKGKNIDAISPKKAEPKPPVARSVSVQQEYAHLISNPHNNHTAEIMNRQDGMDSVSLPPQPMIQHNPYMHPPIQIQLSQPQYMPYNIQPQQMQPMQYTPQRTMMDFPVRSHSASHSASGPDGSSASTSSNKMPQTPMRGTSMSTPRSSCSSNFKRNETAMI